MERLHIEICDLAGLRRPGGLVGQHSAAEVDIELNEARIAKYTVPIWEPIVLEAKRPLTRLSKIYTAGVAEPAIVGLNLLPTYDFEAETAELSWIGAVEFRLQRAFLQTPLTVANRDIGLAMWDLITRAINRAYPIGAPGLGVIQGTIQATYNINRTWDAGQNIWDALVELAQLEGSPDFEFEPLNRVDGYHSAFNAWAPQGVDRSATIVFHNGWGTDNAAGFAYEPDGSVVATTFTAVGTAPDDGSLTQPSYTSHHAAMELEIGLYEGWDVNDATDLAVETAKAKQMVAAYHQAPDFYVVTPAYEAAPDAPPHGWGKPPRFRIDYGVGDITRTIAKKGPFTGANAVNIAGRLRKASIMQVDDSAGLYQVALEHAPNVDTSGVT